MMGLAAGAHGQSPAVEPASLASEVTALKTENIALREQLRRVEEQQKMMLEVVNQLKQRLGPPAPPIAETPLPPSQPVLASTMAPPLPAPPTAVSVVPVPNSRAEQPQSVSALKAIENRYRDGIIIYETSENAEVPFLLRFQGTTQVRYINTLSSQENSLTTWAIPTLLISATILR